MAAGFDVDSFWRQTPRSFHVALQAQGRGTRERIILLAHQTEAMARQKILKEPAHYLKPPQEATPEQGARAVLELFRRAKAKQVEGADHGS